MWRALTALALALFVLLWGWSRLMQVVADAKAAGGQATALDMARADPAGLALFALGLVGAFASMLLSALSFLHVRHVERALARLDAQAARS